MNLPESSALLINDGDCPQCQLEGETISLHLNSADYWQCPRCYLQASSIFPGVLSLLPQRGVALKLKKTTASQAVKNWLLAQSRPHHPFMPEHLIKTEQQLKAVLKSIVI